VVRFQYSAFELVVGFPGNVGGLGNHVSALAKAVFAPYCELPRTKTTRTINGVLATKVTFDERSYCYCAGEYHTRWARCSTVHDHHHSYCLSNRALAAIGATVMCCGWYGRINSWQRTASLLQRMMFQSQKGKN
jgi:hypothetical protein